MKKTHQGEKVYAMTDTQVVKLVNFIDGYIDALTERKPERVDAPYILKNVKNQIINP